MSKTPTAYIDSDGIAWIRCQIPKLLWDVVIQVGRNAAAMTSKRKITDERAAVLGIAQLHRHISDLFEDNDTKWLPDNSFGKALFKLKDSNYGSFPSDTDGVIDINLLHRDPKMKSGFVGVYASGSGYRAISKDRSGKSVTIGTFKTSEVAAYRRRLYHQVNNLPYGELEEEMARWRADPEWGAQDYTDKQLIAAIKDHLGRMPGGMNFVFGPNCCTIEPVFPDEPEPGVRPKGSKLPTREQALGGRGAMIMSNLQAEQKRVAELAAKKPGVRIARDPNAKPAGSVVADPYNPEMPSVPEKNEHGYIDMTGRPKPVKSAIGPDETPVSFDGVVALGFEDGDLPPGVLDDEPLRSRSRQETHSRAGRLGIRPK